jgi:4-hydroxy-tetrahydrodipicolinate synthase
VQPLDGNSKSMPSANDMTAMLPKRQKGRKLSETTSGVFAISPTPFLDDGTIDFDSLDRLTDFYAESGCTGITVLGIMGEAPKLEPKEALDLTKRVIDRAGDLPVVVGVSAAGFAAMRTLSQSVMEAGAAAVMIAPSPTLRTDDQIVSYFLQAVEAIGQDIPWVIQDYPLTLGVVMTPEVIRRIVQDNSSCVMLKHEDWPGLEKISALRTFQQTGKMRPISILTGNGGLFLDFEMERGADGAMTGYAFPDMLVETVRLAQGGKIDAVHDLFDAHLPLIRYEQQQGVGLAVRKYVLMRRGILSSDAQRKPWSRLTPKAMQEIEYLLTRIAKHDKRASFDAQLTTF